jgi:hypothetical protein
MLPLTPANNWTATILFCGGTNLQPAQSVEFTLVRKSLSQFTSTFHRWTTVDIVSVAASASCVYITPDFNGSYVEDDPLPEGRSMGNLILLPDGTIFCLNGAATGNHYSFSNFLCVSLIYEIARNGWLW